MIEHALKYFSVFIVSMFKFILGPLAGASAGLSIVETWIFTALGMMATVTVITFAGSKIRQKVMRRFAKRERKKNAHKNKKLKRFLSKYGLLGIAFLTPIFFSPPGGAILAVSFGRDKKKILLYMLISALWWGFFFSSVFVLSGEHATAFFNR